MNKFIATVVLIVAVYVALRLMHRRHPEELHLDTQRWWGKGDRPQSEDTSIRPFKIDFNKTMIEDLKQRVRNRRPFTNTLEDAQSYYGMNSEYLEMVLNYWINEYNFTRRAELLNFYPHYKTRIQGLDIHFIRKEPIVVLNDIKVLPLLMLHGWPSSSKEFDKVIPLLTSMRPGYKFVFEVIAADLPGFGFSEGTNKQGLNPVQIAVIMRNLMLRLGISKFYIQAGDWGSQVATHLASLFPDNVLGFHTNMPISSRPISNIKLLVGSVFPRLIDRGRPERVYPLRNFLTYIIRESGYFHIQATKPDTIGFALTDSPAGLAAYMMEKIAVCSHRDQLDTPHGGLENLDLDDVLDTVTITWMNECIVTSMRIYSEGLFDKEVQIAHDIPIKVPTAAIKFLHEVVYQPDWILKDKFHNLIQSTIVDYGGHFAALHTPNELAYDLFKATAKFLKFHSKQVKLNNDF